MANNAGSDERLGATGKEGLPPQPAGDEQADSSAPGPELLTVEQLAAVWPAIEAPLDATALGRSLDMRRAEELAEELAEQADAFVIAVSEAHGDHQMTPAVRALWSAGLGLTDMGRSTQGRVGWVLAIDAILATPGLLDVAARDLRARIVASDPDLASYGPVPAAAVAPELAVPRHYSIDETIFTLNRDGSLMVERSGEAITDYYPREVYALLTFLRLPGVAALIDRSQAEYEEQDLLDHENHPERVEARKKEAYDLVMSDPTLRTRAQLELVDAAVEVLKQRHREA